MEPLGMNPPPEVLRFANLTLGYDRHPAVHHLEGGVKRGALTAVVGPNGAGKSTLLKGIVGVLRPLEGRIEVIGVPRRAIAYLPQRAEIDRSFPITVADFIAMGLWHTVGAWGGLNGTTAARIDDALDQVGLSGFERRTLDTLSGGELQRALFARLMLQDAPIMLLDEPFASIDAATTEDLFALIRRWHDEGRTLLVVLHDLDLVRQGFPETLLLARSPIAWGPTAEVLTADNLLRLRRSCEAWDEAAVVCEHSGAHP
jgi:zinc/manganese transport system ATP-binding protein